MQIEAGALYRKLKISASAVKVMPYRPMKFQRCVSEFMYVDLAATEAKADSDHMGLHAVIQGALTTHALYRPIIHGFISAYEYVICLVLTARSTAIRYLHAT